MSYAKGENITNTHPNFETVGDFLNYFPRKKPNTDAVVFCSTDGHRVAVSWKEMCERSYQMARAFVNMGVKPGECVALVTRTCPEWLYVTFGAMLAGARVAGMVYTYNDGSDVIALMKKIGNCSLMVLDPGYESTNWTILRALLDCYTVDGRASSAKMPFLRYLIFIRPPEDFSGTTIEQLLSKQQTEIQLPKSNPGEIAFLFQTSGSTGVPKLTANTVKSLLDISQVLRINNFTENDIFFYERSFSWSGGFPIGLFIGQTRVTVSGFCPEPTDDVTFMIDVICKERCTVAAMFPNRLQVLEKRHAELPSDWPLEAIMIGGQPVTKSVGSCIGRVCKHVILEYGSTESSIGVSITLNDPQQFEDYLAGKPLPGCEYKVIGKDGAILPCGERGELCMRGPCLFKEYLNDPEKTAAAITKDGWYRTDDVGRITKDGKIYAEGRMSDIIISGGTNIVIPAVLESTLKSLPNVKDAVIVPVSDNAMYQVVCACVLVQTGNNITEAKLRDYLNSTHTDDKEEFIVLPKYYIIMEEFPEGRTGKISRTALREMAERIFGVKKTEAN